MSFPNYSSLEMPVLQELFALGGEDDVRFMYERLTAYFPQIDEDELSRIRANRMPRWRKLVQRAGRELDEKGFIERERGNWRITEKGRRVVESEAIGFEIDRPREESPSHTDIQEMLLEIGHVLGFYTEAEFEFYDVVWREVPQAKRLSHVFEVQSKGNIDSAFAKLKRAYHEQRSKIFLVIAGEGDLRRARKSLTREFQDLETGLTILTFAQISRTHRKLSSVREILARFLEN